MAVVTPVELAVAAVVRVMDVPLAMDAIVSPAGNVAAHDDLPDEEAAGRG